MILIHTMTLATDTISKVIRAISKGNMIEEIQLENIVHPLPNELVINEVIVD